MQTFDGDSYYLFMLNMKQIGGYKGPAGFSVRELNSSEVAEYCNGMSSGLFYDRVENTSISLPPIVDKSNFTEAFFLRSFTSGCYYLNTKSGKWESEGLEIMPDTTPTMAHCVTTHLTDFAGGLVVLPPKIDFNYIWANADFAKNPTIYSTILIISAFMIVFAIFGYWLDKRDAAKYKIIPLYDNSPDQSYFYEVIVFTGQRKDAPTDSNVNLIFCFNHQTF